NQNNGTNGDTGRLQITFRVKQIKFSNESNGFAVVRGEILNSNGKPSKDDSTYTFVGYLPTLFEGCELTVKGDWEKSKFGLQFKVTQVLPTTGATVQGLLAYFQSGLVPGIGSKLSERIVSKFGMDTIKVIEEQPEKLREVEGIGIDRAKSIRTTWMANKAVHDIMIFLQSHGVSAAYATRIYKVYGANSVAMLESNPYRLAYDVWGIGFKVADSIAKGFGYTNNDPRRLKAGITYSLEENARAGNTYAKIESFIGQAASLLAVDTSEVESSLEEIRKSDNSPIVFEDDRIYLRRLYYAELEIGRFINRRLVSFIYEYPSEVDSNETEYIEEDNFVEDDAPFNAQWPDFEEDLDQESISSSPAQPIQWSEEQLMAIELAQTSRLLLITGGPGTGKTTVVNAIVSLLKSKGQEVLLAAPTGRAAKRLSEATGEAASTLHRLLGINPSGEIGKNSETPLEGDCLIIDEMSMVDVPLMYRVCDAVPGNMSLILVGDVDQLPSIGPGKVLADILSAPQVAKVMLGVIFRQAKGSAIVDAAHRIISGKSPDLSHDPMNPKANEDLDFCFIETPDSFTAANKVVEIACNILPKRYGADLDSIQVLSPMKKGPCGTNSLNKELQRQLNPIEEKEQNRTLRVGDKVMQIRNNYQKEVFNGQIGKVADINEETGRYYVDFENQLVEYDSGDLAELILAYATTIHKSQGSEYPIVVLPIVNEHSIMLQRNLLYTAVTRAKSRIVLVGQKKAVFMAIKNERQTIRLTSLRERI
ncbi:MAG: ATP-dependent RecD-like DNA helicase, partial [Burkholderiales bacterium]|nr:ATP-dependent RecD-like DNA helicase [Burkholderiales bacterium]